MEKYNAGNVQARCTVQYIFLLANLLYTSQAHWLSSNPPHWGIVSNLLIGLVPIILHIGALYPIFSNHP